MTDLTVAEAKKIVKRGLDSCERTIDYFENGEAKGFLSCHDRMRPLAEAAKLLHGVISEKFMARMPEHVSLAMAGLEEQLADYAKLKGEEGV